MPPPKTILCDGKIYRSVKAWAAAYGKHSVRLAYNLRNGWSPEEAVGLVKRKRPGHGRQVTFEDKTYRSIKDTCDALGLNRTVIQGRMSNGGYSIQDALAGRLNGRGPSPHAKSITYKGVTYPSGTAAAKEFGQKWSNVARRMERGWTLAQALLDAPAPPRFRDHVGHARETVWKRAMVGPEGKMEPAPDSDGYKLYVIRNKRTLKEYVGITTSSLKARLDQHFAAAGSGNKSKIGNALRKYGRDGFTINLIRVDAKNFTELQQQEVNEIASRNTFRNGYNSAWGGSIGTAKPIVVDGKIFPSRAAAAEFYGIDDRVFNLRDRKSVV